MPDYQKIYNLALAEGIKAGQEATVQGMTVVSTQGQCWDVPDGVCGFATIVVKPARGGFVKWLKSQRLGYQNCGGGYAISIREHGQSMQRKEAHAARMALVLSQELRELEPNLSFSPRSMID